MDPLDLNLRHLRALPLIVRHAGMSAAAEAAGLSQPALTQGLAKVEAQLGARLFERGPAGMTPTAEGQAFVARIEAALAHLAAGGRGASARGFSRPDRLMTSTQLRAFLALADSGGFAEAARVTGGSQPAIHRAVRDLEQIGGVGLAERRGRGVSLTARGRQLARGVRLARAEIAAAIADVRPEAGERGRVTVGAMPLCRARLLPAAMAALMRAAPGATFDVVEGSWRELAEPLRDGQIDLMIGALRDSPAPADLDQEALFVDRLVVVARAGHSLAGQGAPTLADLARYPWIIGRGETPLRAHWEALFAGVGVPSAPVECGSVMTIRGLLLDSDCLTLLSADQVAMEVAAGMLALIPALGADMARSIGITTRRGWRPTHLQARLMAALREVAHAGRGSSLRA
ncbi:MAG: LysR family transcriptional regulator [Sphingomonas hengshuiensis]|uniref:LysR family transcriptional regulator n=1 Tax=Sphingomonas hengshuiensis TaxID=1609977 RepID=A0A2W4YY36_9SPHN|nr:MAG: LysR family transcriptional regulator [Sphingomonas hengshuiensis]